MNLKTDNLSIRRAKDEDISSILKIDGLLFSSVWSPSFLRQQLGSSHHIHSVLEIQNCIIGHSGLMVICDEGHITTVAVKHENQGSGAGSLLLADLCRQATELGLTSMTLEVRVSNSKAQSLYRKFGFVPAGVRPNYYSDTNEDALIMWLDDLLDKAVQKLIKVTLDNILLVSGVKKIV